LNGASKTCLSNLHSNRKKTAALVTKATFGTEAKAAKATTTVATVATAATFQRCPPSA